MRLRPRTLVRQQRRQIRDAVGRVAIGHAGSERLVAGRRWLRLGLGLQQAQQQPLLIRRADVCHQRRRTGKRVWLVVFLEVVRRDLRSRGSQGMFGTVDQPFGQADRERPIIVQITRQP